MKRISIDVKDVEFMSNGNVFVTNARDIRFWMCTRTAADRMNLTVEDIPDPLPTEPGERFWGKADGYEPQWWFVVKYDGGDVDVVYIPALGGVGILDLELSDAGLVRLPDPS